MKKKGFGQKFLFQSNLSRETIREGDDTLCQGYTLYEVSRKNNDLFVSSAVTLVTPSFQTVGQGVL